MIKVVFTGGGTGGHRYPLVAVAQALRQIARPDILFIGEAADCASPEIAQLGVTTKVIVAGKLRRYLSWRNLSDLGRVVSGYWQAKRILLEFGPQVVFSKGGYVSVPVVRAAAALRIPIITHESDVVMGLANRLNARVATKVCTAYAKEYYRSLPKDKLVKTGNLIRAELIAAAQRRAPTGSLAIGGRTLFPDKPILLILGGSQGAHRINELIASLLPTLVETYRVVHQCGEGDAEWLNQRRLHLGSKEQRGYYPIPFLDLAELTAVLARATLVISRAGSIISELALFAKPTILIPLSTSAGDHQLRNARLFEAKGAAVVLTERNLKPGDLLRKITKIRRQPAAQAKLVAGLKSLRDPRGASKVAAIIIQYAKK